jgi:SAM-dependent methyltransferase
MFKTRSLDLGCGPTPRNPYNAEEVYGIDISQLSGSNIYSVDLAIESIPFPDNYFTAVTAFHFIEHIPRLVYTQHGRRASFVELMSEIWRVLNGGGIFLSHTPALPDLGGVSQDPTHVNPITEGTFEWYFCRPHCRATMYGFKGSFELVSEDSVNGALLTVLRKLNP